MFYPQPWTRNTVGNSQSNNHSNVIKVTGEGTVSVTPDMATVTLGVISENKDLTTAQQENNQQMTQVINSLLQLGISSESIKTTDYRIEMVYDYVDSKQVLRGYRVIHMLQVTTKDISQVGVIVDTAVSNGANTVSNIEFSITTPSTYQNKALTNALSNAKGKAAVLANDLGVTLQSIPYKIIELGQARPPIPFQTTMFAMSEAATPIQPGELRITATIEAYFTFIS
ncbi:SIMPL domain-containing protein [Fredinandcohnia sp. 179-A 10B2 NHS]|uniref:SIMPL domain-containing protein n=1 Tax=Fredinandcohnia sp. 179-A 10B2 NHS TaxID=3235176 RepID=UPI0039A16F30